MLGSLLRLTEAESGRACDASHEGPAARLGESHLVTSRAGSGMKFRGRWAARHSVSHTILASESGSRNTRCGDAALFAFGCVARSSLSSYWAGLPHRRVYRLACGRGGACCFSHQVLR